MCGKRLRGLSIEEAIKALKSPKKELDIVVAREASKQSSNNHEIPDFFNEDRLRDEHLRIAQKIHAYQNSELRSNVQDFHETCSEVNLSSRPSKNGERIFTYTVLKKHGKLKISPPLRSFKVFYLTFL